jgi:hypothetical protein
MGRTSLLAGQTSRLYKDHSCSGAPAAWCSAVLLGMPGTTSAAHVQESAHHLGARGHRPWSCHKDPATSRSAAYRFRCSRRADIIKRVGAGQLPVPVGDRDQQPVAVHDTADGRDSQQVSVAIPVHCRAGPFSEMIRGIIPRLQLASSVKGARPCGQGRKSPRWRCVCGCCRAGQAYRASTSLA